MTNISCSTFVVSRGHTLSVLDVAEARPGSTTSSFVLAVECSMQNVECSSDAILIYLDVNVKYYTVNKCKVGDMKDEESTIGIFVLV